MGGGEEPRGSRGAEEGQRSPSLHVSAGPQLSADPQRFGDLVEVAPAVPHGPVRAFGDLNRTRGRGDAQVHQHPPGSPRARPGAGVPERSLAPIGLSPGAPCACLLRGAAWVPGSPSSFLVLPGESPLGSGAATTPLAAEAGSLTPRARLGFSEFGQQAPAAAAWIWKGLSPLPDG